MLLHRNQIQVINQNGKIEYLIQPIELDYSWALNEDEIQQHSSKA